MRDNVSALHGRYSKQGTSVSPKARLTKPIVVQADGPMLGWPCPPCMAHTSDIREHAFDCIPERRKRQVVAGKTITLGLFRAAL